MTDNNKTLVSAGHELASELKADCGAVDMRSVANLLTELASALDVKSARSDGLAAELARYSMPAGEADQRMAESRAVRQALGFGQDADDVAPVDLVERINALAAALKASEANDADARCHVAELEEKCAALAAKLNDVCAENAAIKREARWGVIKIYTVFSGDDSVCQGTREKVVPLSAQTPATDAWVNEQRAVGVEMFVSDFTEPAVMNDGKFYSEDLIEASKEFAAQLRGSQV